MVYVGLRNGEQADALAKAAVGHADGCMVYDILPAVDGVVHFAGGYILAAADDDLLFAAVDANATLVVHDAQVSAVKPAVVIERFLGLFGIVQIADELMRPAAGFFSLYAVRNLATILVYDAHFDAFKRHAGKRTVPFGAFLRRHIGVRTAFG